jgi:hypothetical protein
MDRPARTGFQMAFRTGLAFPSGKATAAPGDGLARRYSWQWPLQLDIGSKVTEHVHVGGYATLLIGSEGNDVDIEEYCDDNDSNLENDISCSSYGSRTGVQVQYHFAPDQTTNPWVGYGLGFESHSQTLRDRPRRYSERTTSYGITYAKLDAGIDFRLPVGIGLYGEAAFGRFTSNRTYIRGERVFSGGIDNPSTHVWFLLGLRVVAFP